MAEHDSDPLSVEERAELEQLRAEKAEREAREQARRDRAELETLRAEKAGAAKPTASTARSRAKSASTSAASKPGTSTKATTPAASSVVSPSAQKREGLSFAVRMVTATEPKDDDDIPGMAPAQKIIIALALLAFVVFIGYSIATSTGALG